MTHAEKARELFLQGYNCSQAVFGAFCEEFGMNFETAVKLASSFGGGMGRMREVCGAVSGMFMAAGLCCGYAEPKDIAAKKEHYERIQHLAAEFKQKNGSIVCRELLEARIQKKVNDDPIPEARTAEYYKARPCAQMVADAVEILERYLTDSSR